MYIQVCLAFVYCAPHVCLLCGLLTVLVLFVALRGMCETVEWRSCRQSVYRGVT